MLRMSEITISWLILVHDMLEDMKSQELIRLIFKLEARKKKVKI